MQLESTINRKNKDDVIIYWQNVTVKFFWRRRVSLSHFSYWSNIHVNIITGSRVSTIFFITVWPKVWHTFLWVLTNIWRLEQVTDTKFDMNVCYKKLLNAEKCQVYRFDYFWIIEAKPTGENSHTHTHTHKHTHTHAHTHTHTHTDYS